MVNQSSDTCHNSLLLDIFTRMLNCLVIKRPHELVNLGGQHTNREIQYFLACHQQPCQTALRIKTPGELMAQNRRTVSKFEFNKRIRDLVSRDSNRLRQTFQKFDKEYASRLAEIQSMQEKVRHSMRNLTKEKIQAQLRSEAEQDLIRKESETGETPLLHEILAYQMNDSKNAFTPEEKRKIHNKAPLPVIPVTRSENLQVPRGGEARNRRHSLPHHPTFLPGSPKEIRPTLPRRSIPSLPPKEALSSGSPTETSLLSSTTTSPKQRTHGINLQQHKNGYRLSIHDLPSSLSRSDNLLHVGVKRSPQLYRRPSKLQDANETKNDEDHSECCTEHVFECEDDVESREGNNSKDDPINLEGSDHSPSHFNIVMEADDAKPKSVLKRTRSSSLPVDPETLTKGPSLRDSQSDVIGPVTATSHAMSGKHESLPGVKGRKNEAAPSRVLSMN